MSAHIKIEQKFHLLVDKQELNTIATVVFNFLGIDHTDMTIVIIDDEKMQSLNKQFRKIDRTTDVLSFSSEESDPDNGRPYLGDVIISYPQVLRQAEQYDQTVDSELMLVLIHGILHLLNFNHDNLKDKIIMESLQKKIIEKVTEKKLNK